jgi:protein gp37
VSVTSIEWAMLVWNAIAGCTRVSEGCRNCYAERMAWRHVLMCRALGRPCKYEGTVHLVGGEPRWTGKLNLDTDALDLPLRRRKPATWFVNSMSDLFHEKVEDEWIDKIMARIVLADGRSAWTQHTYQVLTKRPERMHAYMSDPDTPYRVGAQRCEVVVGFTPHRDGYDWRHGAESWPPKRLWLGVSVEDQATADERIPLLLQTPAAVRWVSYEPALGPVNFRPFFTTCGYATTEHFACCHAYPHPPVGLDWIVVGGESGPGARPFDLEWARSTVAQCKAAGAACFVKQLGAQPYEERVLYGTGPWGPAKEDVEERALKLRDRKGGDPAEWPEDLRVREFPRV